MKGIIVFLSFCLIQANAQSQPDQVGNVLFENDINPLLENVPEAYDPRGRFQKLKSDDNLYNQVLKQYSPSTQGLPTGFTTTPIGMNENTGQRQYPRFYQNLKNLIPNRNYQKQLSLMGPYLTPPTLAPAGNYTDIINDYNKKMQESAKTFYNALDNYYKQIMNQTNSGTGTGLLYGYPTYGYGYPGYYAGIPSYGYPTLFPLMTGGSTGGNGNGGTGTSGSGDGSGGATTGSGSGNNWQQMLQDARKKAEEARKAYWASRNTVFRPVQACTYTFQCQSKNLCIQGACIPVGPEHRSQRCLPLLGEQCLKTESCLNYSCLPDSTKSGSNNGSGDGPEAVDPPSN